MSDKPRSGKDEIANRIIDLRSKEIDIRKTEIEHSAGDLQNQK